MSNLRAEDIVERLGRRKKFWLHGKPKIVLEGHDRSFGVLTFDFGDVVVSYRIFIGDRNFILETAQFAIDNFGQLYYTIYEV